MSDPHAQIAPPSTIVKSVADPAAPEQLDTVYANTIVFQGRKNSRTNNTGNVWIPLTSGANQPGSNWSLAGRYQSLSATIREACDGRAARPDQRG